MKVAINKRVAKKLAKLALFIYNDSKVRFDIKNYMTDNYGSCGPSDYKCATSCCALGYAVIVFRKYRGFTGWDEVLYALIEERDKFYGYYDHPVFECLFAPSLPDGRQAIVARVCLYISTGEVGSDYKAIKKYETIKFYDGMIQDLESVLKPKN